MRSGMDHIRCSHDGPTCQGFMGDDIDLNLEFYRTEGGRYPDTPDAIREIALDGAGCGS